MERAELTELLRTWKPPAGLNRSWPREVRLNGSGIFVAVLACILVSGGLVLAVWLQSVARREDALALRLRREGADAVGTVTRLWRSGSGDSRQNWVAFEFTAAGRVEARRTKVKSGVWRSLTVGQAVPVRYLPDNPAVNYLRGSEPNGMPEWAAWLIGLALASVGALLPYLIRRESRLLAEGRAVPGVVTRLTRSQHGSMVHYEFAMPGGGFGKGHCGPNRRAPAPGGIVTVLYDPDNPRRSQTYPLSMVKLADY